MSEKIKPILLIGKILVILALPILFFSYIGQNPMKKTETASREIAIVNEDNGTEFNNNPIYVGSELATTLDKDSEYDWFVVNRSTAESGLANQKYDAVIYFPSDFSENIYTFDDEQPVKAGIKYKVQTSLNAENMEKVQKELEKTKSKMNKHISTQYWSYVSQSVEDIRKKFDNVLAKEIAFQNTMYEFYTPSSESLAGEIKQHKDMLEGVFAQTKDAGKTSNETMGELGNTKAQMASFVKDVVTFEEYQQAQSDLFAEASAQNQQLITESVQSYDKVLNEGNQSVPEIQQGMNTKYSLNDQGINENVGVMQQKIDSSNNELEEFSTNVKDKQVEQISKITQDQQSSIEQIKQSEEAGLDTLQATLLAQRGNLASSPGDGEDVTDGGTAPIEEIETETGKGESGAAPSKKDPIDELSLQGLLDQINGINTALESLVPAEGSEGTAEQINILTAELQAEINNLSGTVNGRTGNYNQVITEFNTLVDSYTELLAQFTQLQDDYNKLGTNYKDLGDQWKKSQEDIQKLQDIQSMTIDESIAEIKNLEQALLEKVGGERRAVLVEVFNDSITNRDSNDLLAYYGSLSSYSELAERVTEANIDKVFAANIKELENLKNGVSVNVDEEAKLVKASLAGVNENFGMFSDSILGYMNEYDANVKSGQEATLAELAAITERAQAVSANLSEHTVVPEMEPEPPVNLDGEMFVSLQDNTAKTVGFISELVNSVAERQDTVTKDTADLQAKVGSVQERADQLNDNWSQNVDSTVKIKTDVYSVLNNTLVDDQQNGYVYEYLANPVQISGEVLHQEKVNIPPIVMLVIILISGLLIGFFLHHYGTITTMVHAALFTLLNLIVGLIISMYGLKIYPLGDIQEIKWTVFTVLLLFFCSAFTRLAFSIGPFVGSVLVIGLISFFTIPLLDLIMPNFNVDHPIADVYMSIQFGDQSAFIPAIVILIILTLIGSIIPYIVKRFTERREMAHEVD
ncbi:ESX secretion system protein YueB [Peribacillus sp. Bi96]|uniref:type VII secretion protein EsaA n=1 Tax=Peribacillus sp. Bi96 TaxID=2884273 RepID=UPI001E019D48|nr:type VII secretion protein EsaA [Peribacillus sp. Bi96]CAH0302048.1 ESX secretion system protein YueB [Peribacillus sp. Bi96]